MNWMLTLCVVRALYTYTLSWYSKDFQGFNVPHPLSGAEENTINEWWKLKRDRLTPPSIGLMLEVSLH